MDRGSRSQEVGTVLIEKTVQDKQHQQQRATCTMVCIYYEVPGMFWYSV